MLTCPKCGYVTTFGGSVIRCLSPRCTWEKRTTEADRQHLIRDVTTRLAHRAPRRAA